MYFDNRLLALGGGRLAARAAPRTTTQVSILNFAVDSISIISNYIENHIEQSASNLQMLQCRYNRNKGPGCISLKANLLII